MNACSYWHKNPNGSYTPSTGYGAVVNAIMDGLNPQVQNNGVTTGDWTGTQGISGVNARDHVDYTTQYFGIGFGYVNQTFPPFYGTNWGGVVLGNSDTASNAIDPVTGKPLGDLLIRETYVGDSNLDGSVDVGNDYSMWSDNFGQTIGQNPANNAQNTGVGISSGDYGMFSFLGNGGVDVGNDYSYWSNTFGNPLGQLGPGEVVQAKPVGGSAQPAAAAAQPAGIVAAVPEPGTICLLLIAGVAGLFSIASKKFLTLISFGKVLVMKRVGVAVVAACIVAGLAASAQAELVYFMRPVTGSASVVGIGSGDSEGDYTIAGNGITAPFTVTIAPGSLPAAGTTDVISFELYAALVGRTMNWKYQGFTTGNFYIQETGATPLNLVPDPGDASWENNFGGQLAVAGPSNNLYGNPNNNNQNFQNTASGYTFPGTKANSFGGLMNSATAGNNWVANGYSAAYFPGSALETGGTIAMVKLADVYYTYDNTLSGGTSTLQMVPFFNTNAPSTPAGHWIMDATKLTTNPPTGGTNSLVNYGTNPASGPTSIQSSFTFMNSGAATFANTNAVTVVYGSSGPTYAAGQLSIATGPTATPGTVAGVGTSNAGTVFSGGLAAIAGTVTNGTYSVGSNTQDNVNWTMGYSGAVGGTLAGVTVAGSGLTPGGTSPYSLTYKATVSGFFGPDTITLTPTGTNVNYVGALNNTPGAAQVTVNVLGVANKGGVADGSGTAPTWNGSAWVGGVYGPTLTSATLANGASLVGMETCLAGSESYGIGATYAKIMAGTSTGGAITMAWRSRTTSETPAGAASLGILPLVSDVLNLNGITGGSNEIFTLQMSFDPNQIGNGSAAAIEASASDGFLFLGYRSTTDGKWHNATATLTDGNTSVGADAYHNGTAPYIGSWAAFTAGAGNGYTLQQLLGSWGVDTVNNTAWAVVDHDAEFAVVPEPGTLALLAAGAVALGVAYRRRKAAKAS